MSEVRVLANVLLEEAVQGSMDQVRGALRAIGLSGYAADAFCALVRVAEATAGDLVLKTRIPDSKIYYALNELVKMGLVEVQAGKPKMYRAVSHQQVVAQLQRVLDARHRSEKAAVSRVGSLLEPIQIATRSPSTDLAYIVKGHSNVIARARSMVASSRREVLLITLEESFLRKLEEGLLKVAHKGVNVRLAVPDIALKNDLERLAEVRSIVCSGRVLVVDQQQILTVNRTMDGDSYGITSTDEMLVRLGLDYWESPRCCVR